MRCGKRLDECLQHSNLPSVLLRRPRRQVSSPAFHRRGGRLPLLPMRRNQQLGWVYLIANKSMPGKAKIGFTFDDPRERDNQLSSSTGVPSPFVVIYAVKTPNPAELEDEIHHQLQARRVVSNREFFSTAI